MKNEIIKVTCIDISLEAFGIAKYNDLVIFVKGLLPNEEALVKIIKMKKNYAIGIIEKLLNKNDRRIESICPIAYKCGGCDFRHANYNYQLEIKKQFLEKEFKDLDIKINDVLRSDNELYYRNKVQIPVRDKKFGFYRKHSNDIVEFETCFIQFEEANQIFNDLKELILNNSIDKYIRHIFLRKGFGSNEIMLALIVNDFDVPNINDIIQELIIKYPNIKSIILSLNKRNDNVILGDEELLLYGNDYIIDEFEGLKFKISLKSFYQVNYYQMINLYKLIKEIADLNNEDIVLDLYSGIGTISLFISKYVKKVYSVEIVKEAHVNALENIRINNIDNIECILSSADKVNNYFEKANIVIVDPPRKGLSESLINDLIKYKVNKIIYVSCNYMTLKRDLELLKDYYNISDIYPVDMFPYTKGIETVVKLNLK